MRVLITVILLGSAFVPAVNAQSPTDSETMNVLDGDLPIVLTPSRLPQWIDESPSTVTVIPNTAASPFVHGGVKAGGAMARTCGPFQRRYTVSVHYGPTAGHAGSHACQIRECKTCGGIGLVSDHCKTPSGGAVRKPSHIPMGSLGAGTHRSDPPSSGQCRRNPLR